MSSIEVASATPLMGLRMARAGLEWRMMVRYRRTEYDQAPWNPCKILP